jgi:arylsulfatase A-like enzyme
MEGVTMQAAISRRAFMAASAGATLAAAAGRAEETPATPHVLVIHTDQHRWDCLGAYGHPDVKTPHIDALAAEGVRFDNHFCPYPVCTPSRYSMLSGQYVFQHGGHSNHCTLTPGTPTFATVLRDAGYNTAAVGKMHFAPTYLDVGFDQMLLAEQDGPGRWDDDYHRALKEAGLVDRNDLEDQRQEYRGKARERYWETFGAMPSNLPEEWHSTTWIAGRALEQLEGWSHEKPGLLMAGFIKPHHPFDPPQEWADRYDPDALTILPGWTEEPLTRDLQVNGGYFPHPKLSEPALRMAMAYYYATISQIDYHVGRMVELLKKKGLYDDTLILFTSDHGEYLGFHHLLLKGNHLYDPVVKVPLIIKYPKGRDAGRVSDDLVSNVDVAPTILAAASLPIPEGMRGRDLRGDAPARDTVFAEGRAGKHVMLRSKTRKLILNDVPEESLFFDLETDPMEISSLLEDPAREEEVAILRETLAEDWRLPGQLPRPPLDHDAPCIDAPNVPPPGNRHRQSIAEYYEAMMEKL